MASVITALTASGIALGGCVSLVQTAPPDRPWSRPRQHCHDSDSYGYGAALLAVGFAVAGVVRYATADDDFLFSAGELQGLAMIGASGVFMLDTTNAFRQAERCRDYQRTIDEAPRRLDPDQVSVTSW